MLQILAFLGFGLTLHQDNPARADVTFQNDSSYAVRIFLPESGLNVGPIQRGQSLLVDMAFVTGSNRVLIARALGSESARSLRRHAASVYHEHYVRPVNGKSPGHVNLDIDDQVFNTITSKERPVAQTLDNRTDYPVYAMAEGSSATHFAPPKRAP